MRLEPYVFFEGRCDEALETGMLRARRGRTLSC
jgi:hypothetical protein